MLELMEVAGFPDAPSLAKSTPEHVAAELERANGVLKLVEKLPSQEHIAGWIGQAHQWLNEARESEEIEPGAAINFENEADVQEMLQRAPLAIPVTARVLVEHDIPVAEVPIGLLLSEAPDGLEIRVTARKPSKIIETVRDPDTRSRSVSKPVAEKAEEAPEDPPPIPESEPEREKFHASMRTSRLGIETDKVRKFGDELPPTIARPNVNERVMIMRAPRAETNKGRTPESRFYIRGVLHTHPGKIRLAAIITLACQLLMPLAVVGGLLLLLSDPDHGRGYFTWVPKWFLAFPLALPIAGLFYLLFVPGARCRICGQSLFVPKMCLKNKKAHHIPVIGYIFPLCLHLLTFKWFRCTFCGTSVRLKE